MHIFINIYVYILCLKWEINPSECANRHLTEETKKVHRWLKGQEGRTETPQIHLSISIKVFLLSYPHSDSLLCAGPLIRVVFLIKAWVQRWWKHVHFIFIYLFLRKGDSPRSLQYIFMSKTTELYWIIHLKITVSVCLKPIIWIHRNLCITYAYYCIGLRQTDIFAIQIFLCWQKSGPLIILQENYIHGSFILVHMCSWSCYCSFIKWSIVLDRNGHVNNSNSASIRSRLWLLCCYLLL